MNSGVINLTSLSFFMRDAHARREGALTTPSHSIIVRNLVQ
jgi:hypothetical protein